MNPFIRLLYAVLIAVAVVTFVGMGIATFYPAPKAPDYPQTPAIADKVGDNSPSAAAQHDYEVAYARYQEDNKNYSRTVSVLGSVIAVAVVGVGLYVRRRSDVIGEGIALGGVATSVYAVVTAVTADDRVMRFVAVSVFLASSIAVVYVLVSDQAQVKKQPSKSTAAK